MKKLSSFEFQKYVSQLKFYVSGFYVEHERFLDGSELRADASRKVRRGDFSNIWKSSLIAASLLCE